MVRAPSPPSCPKTYPLGRPHWLPAFSTSSASPCEIVPKNRCPASMTSFEEYCPLCEGGLLASGGLLAGGGPPPGGGYACARADSVPQGTRVRTRRVVRIIVCIACSVRGRAVQRSPTKLCGFNICSRTNLLSSSGEPLAAVSTWCRSFLA